MHIPSYPVHTAAHCNPLQLSAANHPVHTQCTHTAAAITSSVHTAAMYSHVQLSATITFSAESTMQPSATNTIQCTLQLYHPVHTAATLSGDNTIQCIQCTSGPPQGKPIPLLAYLQSSQQTLIQWLNLAVPKMKKTG